MTPQKSRAFPAFASQVCFRIVVCIAPNPHGYMNQQDIDMEKVGFMWCHFRSLSKMNTLLAIILKVQTFFYFVKTKLLYKHEIWREDTTFLIMSYCIDDILECNMKSTPKTSWNVVKSTSTTPTHWRFERFLNLIRPDVVCWCTEQGRCLLQ